MSGVSTERMECLSLICFVANKPLPAAAVGLDVTLLPSMCWLEGAILENGNTAETMHALLRLASEGEGKKCQEDVAAISMMTRTESVNTDSGSKRKIQSNPSPLSLVPRGQNESVVCCHDNSSEASAQSWTRQTILNSFSLATILAAF